jgi:non-specific serine/threonine protein kinase
MLAERSGVSQRAIQLLEADSVRPRRSTIGHLTEALSITGPDRDDLERMATPLPRGRLAATSGGARARSDGPASLTEARPQLTDDDREHGLLALPRPAPTNVPWPVSSLLGREHDLSAICDLIAVDRRRLVTLTGVGGSGKTRLAVQVAADLLDTFADGVWFVELAPMSSPSLVPQVLAGVLGVREGPDVPIVDTLVDFLRRKRLLLVLDNCEHLIDACATLAERLLTACPGLSILATSREPLRIAGERRWQVHPLAVPNHHAGAAFTTLADSPSVRLFVERAQAIQATFRLTPENVTSVAEVCARLEGIPLAIELAASRVAMLAVEQLVERLATGFRVLASRSRDGPTRQQTMEAALAWSYDLLAPGEQRTFRALSTFAGGFDLDAAQAIRGTDDDDEAAIFDGLSQLVDKSLVVTEQATHGRRYRLLEPVRHYAQQSLLKHGEATELRTRHAAHYAALAERVSPLLRGPEQIHWLDRLEDERDNLRTALGWLTEHGDVDDGLRLAVAMAPFWDARGYLGEGRRWLALALTMSRAGVASRAIQVRALLAAGGMATWQRDLEGAEALLNEALEAARSLADRSGEAEALARLATVLRHLCMTDQARLVSESCVTLARQLEEDATIAFVLRHLGMLLGPLGETERAISVLEECLMRYRRLGDVRHVAIAATVLGRIIQPTGDHTRASALLREAVLTVSAIGDRANLVDALGGLAYAAMVQGEAQQAAQWLAASQTIRRALGMRSSAPNQNYDQSIHESLQRQLTASELDAAYAAGAAMSLDQVVAEILAAQ